jgi:hypothetical protein
MPTLSITAGNQFRTYNPAGYFNRCGILFFVSIFPAGFARVVDPVAVQQEVGIITGMG